MIEYDSVSIFVVRVIIVVIQAHFIFGHLSNDVIGRLSVTLHKLLYNRIIIQLDVNGVPDHLLHFVLHVLYVGHGAVLGPSEFWAMLSPATSPRPTVVIKVLRGVYTWPYCHRYGLSGIPLAFLPRSV